MVGALVVAAALLAVMLTSRPAGVTAPVAQAPLDQAAVEPQAPPAEASPEAHGGLNPDGPAVQLIGLTDARAHFDAGTALFIDLRSGSEYAAGRIPGALTITSSELEDRMQSLPDGAVIIAYGDAERPESGQRGAQIFMELGYPTVIALDGGFQGWRDAGHPVESSQ
jgi:rhodanese-related sulfurtransferase